MTLKVSSRNVTDVGVLELAENSKLLKNLELNGCELVTDEGVKALAKNCTLLSLTLSCCRNVTNDAFSAASLEGLKQLSALDLTRCLNVTDLAIKQIARDCSNLQTLNLSSCEDITDAAIMEVADKCKNLT